MSIRLFAASVLTLLVGGMTGQTLAPDSSTQGTSPSSSVEVVGCLSGRPGEFKLTDEDGNVYDLIGKTAGLNERIGDQLRIRGIQEHSPTRPTQYSLPEATLKVADVTTLVHANPSGVRPSLGDPITWESRANSRYGVALRYPKQLANSEGQDPHVESNFVGQAGTARVSFEGLVIPSETFPHSNFVGGSFTLFVDPTIRSNGTCRQFSSFWPKHTSTHKVHGIPYVQTLFIGAAMGTVSSVYYFHTFQNGLCYELDFDLDETNTTGMMLPCSTQWLSERNEFELMDALLSQVRFLRPELKPARAKYGKPLKPTVLTFDHSLVTMHRSTSVVVSWTSEGADYVQIHYRCVKNLIVTELASERGTKCQNGTDSNFPSNGSLSLMPENFNNAPVALTLTIEPFLNGAGYSKRSRTIAIPIDPHPSVLERTPKPPSF